MIVHGKGRISFYRRLYYIDRVEKWSVIFAGIA